MKKFFLKVKGLVITVLHAAGACQRPNDIFLNSKYI